MAPKFYINADITKIYHIKHKPRFLTSELAVMS